MLLKSRTSIKYNFIFKHLNITEAEEYKFHRPYFYQIFNYGFIIGAFHHDQLVCSLCAHDFTLNFPIHAAHSPKHSPFYSEMDILEENLITDGIVGGKPQDNVYISRIVTDKDFQG